jgi:NodT family efflux transporter outer membrane factor (OMF) lipoprotein
VEGKWVQKTAISEHPYGAAEEYWWRSFHDPVLNRLVETAYAQNVTLQLAGTRVLEARAKLNATIGNLFPQQQGIGGNVNYYHLGESRRGGLPSAEGPAADVLSHILDRNNVNPGDFQIGPNIATDRLLFSTSWEIDFWGKYRRQVESQKAGWLASVAAYDDALVSLVSDVASAYVNLRTLESRLAILRQSVAAQEESLKIADVRFKAGETSELDPLQAKTELSKTKAEIPALENGITQVKNALAVLLGITPAEIGGYLRGGGGIPRAPGRVAAGIPHDLLRRRPDVRMAGLQAATQSPRIGVAVAEMLPAFSLNGGFGSSGSNIGGSSLSDLFNWQSTAVQAGGSFVMPILNYGRLVNNVRIEDARFQQAVLNYQNTVLKAQTEVENGLSAFDQGKRTMVLLNEANGTAKKTMDLALVRYQQGQADYTTVLIAQQQQLAIANAAVSSHGSAIVALISVYRGLGGGWQLREGGDVISATVKAEMARRSNWGKMLEPSRHLPETSPEDAASSASPTPKPKEAKP